MDNKPSLLFVSGFGWTGASAMVDFLRDFENVERSPSGEIQFINSLHQIIIKLKSGKELDLTNGLNEQIFLGEIPLKYKGKREEYHKEKLSKFFENFADDKTSYKEYSYKVLQDLIKYFGSNQKNLFKKTVTDYVLYIDEGFRKNNVIYIYDNTVSAQNLSFFENILPDEFSQLKIYVVDRDPRDQYYELIKRFESGHSSKSNLILNYFNKIINTIPFVKNILSSYYFVNKYHLKRRRGIKKDIKNITKNFGDNSIEIIQFEDLVINEEGVRDRLVKDICNMYNTNYSGLNIFAPEESSENISVHRNEKKHLGYKYLENRLEEYIYLK